MSRASSASAKLLACGNDAVIAECVCGQQGIGISFAVGIDVIPPVPLVEEEFHQALSLHPAKPVAQHDRNIGLQFRSQSRFLFEPAIVRNRMP